VPLRTRTAQASLHRTGELTQLNSRLNSDSPPMPTTPHHCEKDSEAVLGVWLPAPADAASAACSRRALAVCRWRGEKIWAVTMFDLAV